MVSRLSVAVLVPDRMMRSGHALTLDILETANRIAGRDRTRPFLIREIAVGQGDAADAADLVILPGLGLSSEAEILAARSDGFLDAIAVSMQCLKVPGTCFATSCSGVFAFAHAGLLDSRAATTTWWLAPLFSRFYPHVDLKTEALVVEDGPVLTAGAALAHADLMLHLVARFAGQAIARSCMRYLVLDERSNQNSYVCPAGMIAGDPQLLRAEHYAQSHLTEPITVGDLAAAAGLAPRTFARRLRAVSGTTPIAFIQSLRIARACDLALTTRLSQDQIAAKVGYGDANALRRIMKKQIGRTIESLRT